MKRTLFFLIFCLFLHSNTVFSQQQLEFKVKHFEVKGQLPIEKAIIEQALLDYNNKSYTLDQLHETAKMVEKIIRDSGYSFYRAFIPSQKFSNGIVTLELVEFSIGEINILGNNYFDRQNIKSSLPDLLINTSPNMKEVSAQVKLANKHPSKKLKLNFEESQTAGKINANLKVQDNSPHNFTLVGSNTGTDETGDFRTTIGYEYTNLWNKDHIVNISYTTSPGYLKEVSLYGGSYSIPFYSLNSQLTGYYIYSDVDSGVVADVFNISGAGQMAGLHYLQNIGQFKQYEHWIDIGYDDQLFENDIDYFGSPIGIDIRSAPLSIMYKADTAILNSYLSFYSKWRANSGWGSKNKDIFYAATRAGARKNWKAFTYGATINHTFNHQIFKDWSILAKLNGQYSSEPLISGEQFGIGGSYSVRGYKERETSADTGAVVNLELYAPSWKGITPVIFIDHGQGLLENALPGEDASWYLTSAGLGLKIQWKDSLYLNLDLARAFEQGLSTKQGDFFLHASIFLRY